MGLTENYSGLMGPKIKIPNLMNRRKIIPPTWNPNAKVTKVPLNLISSSELLLKIKSLAHRDSPCCSSRYVHSGPAPGVIHRTHGVGQQPRGEQPKNNFFGTKEADKIIFPLFFFLFSPLLFSFPLLLFPTSLLHG